MNNVTFDRMSLRLSGTLLLAGQLLYIVVTLFHAGGDANNHHAIFTTYAANAIWTAVHTGQFVAMAVLLAGLFALFFALDDQAGPARWAARFGAASTVATLALYGVVQAVDGVALKQAVNAWASAPEAEKAARFATAEALRWLEWGTRSYQNFALALAFFLFAAALARTAWVPRPVALLMALSGLTYVAQGWIGGTEGFTPSHATAIVLSWVLNLPWMSWLILASSRPPRPIQPDTVRTPRATWAAMQAASSPTPNRSPDLRLMQPRHSQKVEALVLCHAALLNGIAIAIQYWQLTRLKSKLNPIAQITAVIPDAVRSSSVVSSCS